MNTTTLARVDPTQDNLNEIRAIDDPVDRAWAAESLRRAAVALGKRPDAPTRALISDAAAVSADAVSDILDRYAELQPLNKIDDLGKRGWFGEALRRASKARAKEHRDKRDRAGLILLQPFARAVLPTNIEKRKVRAAYKAGKMSPTEYYDRLRVILEKRHKALADANVTIEPADVYKPMGVSRARLIQMMEEVSVEGLPRMRNATQVLEDTSREVERLVAIQREVSAIRNAVLDVLLASNSNAEVARMTGMTTARVSQYRNGTR